MKFGAMPLASAEGAILAHNLYDADGKRLMNKGRFLKTEDIQKLREHNFTELIVARADANDVHENVAAQRVGNAIAGTGIRVNASGVGRANLMSTVRGVLQINIPALAQLNNIYDGICVVTMREHTLVDEKELVVLVKIIPFFVPSERVIDIEQIAIESQNIIRVRPLVSRKVALIITGPEAVREKLISEFHEPVKKRIVFLDSELLEPVYVPHEPESIANAMRDHADSDLILVASVSAIIDRDDVVPEALRRAGGSITIHGLPVDPGTLMMMGYLNQVPVIGAPGCIKSPKTNVIDLLLPRIIAGERLTRSDLVQMGYGGLLDDIKNRPAPRSE